MRWSYRALRKTPAGRAGVTLMEVLLALAIFLIGSVSIIGLFVAASVLHVEAGNRRTASFIAEELLAGVTNLRFREVFARTTLEAGIDGTATTIPALAVSPDVDSQGANFHRYPLSDLFFPLRPGQAWDQDREEGAILVEGEWVWYGGLDEVGDNFTACDRATGWALPAGDHLLGQYILQPRTWYYVVSDAMTAGQDFVAVAGDPTSWPAGGTPGAPENGYIVIDEEWMPYVARDASIFAIDPTDADGDGIPDVRGYGGTAAVAHSPGTPVTVAREHPLYPGFYYTVQFYPINPGGAEAHVVVSVGYRTGNMFRAWFFRSIYAPTSS